MGSTPHVLGKHPWPPASLPATWKSSALWLGVTWRAGRATQQGQAHLRDGPGTAAPGVQHDRVLMSFLQHFILKRKTHSVGETTLVPEGFFTASRSLVTHSGLRTSSISATWEADEKCRLTGLSVGLWKQNLHLLPGDSYSQLHN